MQDAAAPREFNTTHWSLVLAAQTNPKDQASKRSARKALESLCKAYWFPLYAFVRQRGNSSHDAQDLTQSFFATFIEKEGFAGADPKRGRFRSYLLGSLKHFLSHERERRAAKKRGGGVPLLEYDAKDLERRFVLEPFHSCDPDERFNREWAQAVNHRALKSLKQDFERRGKGAQFDAMKESLTGVEPDWGGMAQRLGIGDGALKVAVHRFRKRYRERLRAELAETVLDPRDVDDELRCLVAALLAQ